ERNGGDPQKALDALADDAASIRAKQRRRLINPRVANPRLQAIADAEEAILSGQDIPPYKAPGHMYEARINADPEHFLDWDNPLAEQHPVVQTQLARIGIRKPPEPEPLTVDWREGKNGTHILYRSDQPNTPLAILRPGGQGAGPGDWFHVYRGTSAMDRDYAGAGTTLQSAKTMAEAKFAQPPHRADYNPSGQEIVRTLLGRNPAEAAQDLRHA